MRRRVSQGGGAPSNWNHGEETGAGATERLTNWYLQVNTAPGEARQENAAMSKKFRLLHGEHRRFFTQVEVKAKDGHQKSNMVIIPPKDAGNKPHFIWLQHPIQEKQFELIFNADSAQGTSGFTGLKFVALAGYVSEEGERETKKKKK